jgi:hypothetical protein
MTLEPYHISLLGMIADIIGVFLLLVEAIKLDNFKKLRDRIFIPLDHSVSFSSEKYKPIYAKEFLEHVKRGRPGPFTVKKEEANAYLKVFYHFYFTYYIGGFIVSVIIVCIIHSFFIDLNALISSIIGFRVGYLLDVAALLGLLLIVLINWIFTNYYAYKFAATDIPIYMFSLITLLTPPSIIFMIVGELLHIFLATVDKIVLSSLNFIERKTPDGTIGILGFMLATLGFIMQFYGTWASN